MQARHELRRVFVVYSERPSERGGIEHTVHHQLALLAGERWATFLGTIARRHVRPRSWKHAVRRWRRITRLTRGGRDRPVSRTFIVHGFSDPGLLPFAVARPAGRHRVIWQPHMHPFAAHARPLASRVYFHVIGRRLGQRADAIVAVNPNEAAFLARWFGTGKVHLIPHFVPDPSAISDSGPTTQFRVLDKPPIRPYVLFVGRDDANKRVGHIVACASDMAEAGFHIVLVTRTQRVLPDNVQLRSGVPTDELMALYRGAAFTLVPSKHEAFSLVALESLSHGTPVVATTGVQLRSFPVTEGAITTYDGTCAGLRTVLSDPPARLDVVMIERIRRTFSAASFERAWRTLLDEVERDARRQQCDAGAEPNRGRQSSPRSRDDA